MTATEIPKTSHTEPESDGPRLIHEITLRNLLSFGPDTPPLELRSLNVLIGPNGSGKSNLIEAVNLLRAAPNDFSTVFRRGGGAQEWIWKGRPNENAELSLTARGRMPHELIQHCVEFEIARGTYSVLEEQVRTRSNFGLAGDEHTLYLSTIWEQLLFDHDGRGHRLEQEDRQYSILRRVRDPLSYPEFDYLSEQYERSRIYREWSFGRTSIFRTPQPADVRNDRLEEDFSNLGLFLNRLRRKPKAKQSILTRLRDLYEGLDDFDVSVEGGTVQVFFTEGDFTIPATRLSDGSLRYLCLLAILCDPEPPPLICIEEPELGLHPDLLPKVANLLIETSRRTQLIVTTHSEILVDALTPTPEAVVVCEKHEGKTTMQRLDPDGLVVWLEKYRLGNLWSSGQIGGNRW